ncbi:MAG: addiction module protein [Pirellulales bacterium]
MSTVNEVLSAAMALPPGDRAAIANRLFASLDEDEIQLEWHPEWAEELSARTNAIAEGTATFMDGKQAVKEIRESLTRRDSP